MNRFKTFLLLGLVTSLLVALGAYLGKGWLIGCTVAAFALNLGAYFWSDRLVLRMQGAEELPEREAPALHADVAELAARAGIPKPRVFLVRDEAPNAFATGRNPEHGVVAFTEGLLRTCPAGSSAASSPTSWPTSRTGTSWWPRWPRAWPAP